MAWCSLFFLLLTLIGNSLQDDITPAFTELLVSESETASLSCKYNAAVRNLQWYRQNPGSKPEFIIMLFESGDPVKSIPPHPRASGESVGNGITSSHSSLVVIEGGNATFSCNYSSSTSGNSLQWYRQDPNSIPEFLYFIYEAGTTSETVPRLTPSIKKEEKRVFLELSSAEASDSAVYYCALRPTVTGTQTLLCKNLSDVQEEGDSTCPLHRQRICWKCHNTLAFFTGRH
ncbi:uncharacterized protein LOC143134639 [Alosa pseudoharengus]|uniref:uncharacterized protein LOC143134639 n=1 Tax=Alosa pseudoharengus TaxID=34774 RepID=UPI003F8B84D4